MVFKRKMKNMLLHFSLELTTGYIKPLEFFIPVKLAVP
jgi:hypothetical protein